VVANLQPAERLRKSPYKSINRLSRWQVVFFLRALESIVNRGLFVPPPPFTPVPFLGIPHPVSYTDAFPRPPLLSVFSKTLLGGFSTVFSAILYIIISTKIREREREREREKNGVVLVPLH